MVLEGSDAIARQLREHTVCMGELKELVLEVKNELQQLKEVLKFRMCTSSPQIDIDLSQVSPEGSVTDTSNMTSQPASSICGTTFSSSSVSKVQSDMTFGSLGSSTSSDSFLVPEVVSNFFRTSLVTRSYSSASRSFYFNSAFQASGLSRSSPALAAWNTMFHGMPLEEASSDAFGGDDGTKSEPSVAHVYEAVTEVVSRSVDHVSDDPTGVASHDDALVTTTTTTVLVGLGTAVPSSIHGGELYGTCGVLPVIYGHAQTSANFQAQVNSSDNLSFTPTFCIPVFNQNRTTLATSPPRRSGDTLLRSQRIEPNPDTVEKIAGKNHLCLQCASVNSAFQVKSCTNLCVSGRQQNFTIEDSRVVADTAAQDDAPSWNEDGGGAISGEDAATTCDPHFEPIKALTEVNEVWMGEQEMEEEEKEKVFGEKAELYRYEKNSKERKEQSSLSTTSSAEGQRTQHGRGSDSDSRGSGSGEEAGDEDSDDDCELAVFFETDGALLLRKDHGQLVDMGASHITIAFDDRRHVGHIYVFSSYPVSDICIDDNCTVKVEGSVCEWTGLDTGIGEHVKLSTFSADMASAAEADDFSSAVAQCKKMLQNPELYGW